jgi:dolichol-phosphate mannosyltransferase
MDGSPAAMTRSRPTADAPVALSVVIPMHNEAGNAEPLLAEVVAALSGRLAFEVVCVDDASTDGTVAELAAAAARLPELRVLRHTQRSGQSAALRTGVKAARAPWVATLDGDGQNDPADLLRLLARRDQAGDRVHLFAGWRQQRRDTAVKRLSSRIANGVRRGLLHDQCPDTGCALKLYRRDSYLDLPWFDHMHRYLPALFRRAGWEVETVPVGHRPRLAGRSKYGIGNRLWVGIVDLFGVAWLMRRSPITAVQVVTPVDQEAA